MRRICITLCFVCCCSVHVEAGDWPQSRYDAGRGAVSPDELPDELHLQWVRELPAPRPAWPASQPWLRFDLSYTPVAAGGLLFVPSMVTDSVTAYDTATGEERWRFYTDGPVRLAPVVYGGRVYFGSDDGYLYCVDAAEGRLAWRFRGGPSDRKVLGNERLISTWPVRGGPVLHRGTIYFTAGIWPFMGIFVHAVDAETGEAVWTNSGFATNWTVQPHNSPAFASLVPRGHLAATEQGLVVPGGRTEPGRFDLATGEFRGFDFGARGAGSHHVTARRDWLFVTGTMRQIADGKTLLSTEATVHDEQALYGTDGDDIFAQALEVESYQVEQTDRKGKKVKVTKHRLQDLWKLDLPEAPGRLFLKAGSRFYAAKEGEAAAIEVDPQAEKAEIAWRSTFDGAPWTMLAAADRLFVVTVEGRIYCFGADERQVETYHAPPELQAVEPGDNNDVDPFARFAGQLVSEAGAAGGYCVLFGQATTALAEYLTCPPEPETLPKMRVIAIHPDEEKVDAARRKLHNDGVYGGRVSFYAGDPATFPLPPYLASVLFVLEPWSHPSDSGVAYLKAVFRALRPYGGTAFFPTRHGRIAELVEAAGLPGAKVKQKGLFSLLVREGPLPGAADWTHHYADAANSIVSRDQRVKAPLGLLWFGGPPNDEVLPRHGHGPAPQVAAGRLFIEGRNMLRALDAYTGLLLWQKDLPSLGEFHDRTGHQPGAGEIGSNYVSLADCVYVVYGDAILELDAATGEEKKQFRLAAGGDDAGPSWGFLAAWDDLLVATSTPVMPAPEPPNQSGTDESQREPQPVNIESVLEPVRYASASRRLVVFNRHTGRELWHRDAAYGFRHNNIALGAGKLFAIDALSKAKQQALRRRGVDLADYAPRLFALNARTGEEIWSTSEHVFGTFLNYSEEYDVLLQAGSAARDRAKDETDTGMIAYRGGDGSVLWNDLQRKHAGPCMLHHDTIITQGPAYWLTSGEPKLREHPLSGEPIPWQFTRYYGCNTAIASEHLITFRSAAAGYYDLAADGGTGNLGGFKSGCTSNLVAAGGLLNAPEYTRTCECRYQNQTSLALVHDPEAEMWTFNALEWDGKPVRRVGINFGAPGDRRAPSGTLWMDYPSVGGPSPDLPLAVEIDPPDYFRLHSSQIRVPPDSAGLAWVAGSGLKGAGRLRITLAEGPTPDPRNYTVRLHFAEVERVGPGGRVFAVRLQDEEVLSGFDPTGVAGEKTAIVREFRGIRVADTLDIGLVPEGGEGGALPILCGVEIVAQGW